MTSFEHGHAQLQSLSCSKDNTTNLYYSLNMNSPVHHVDLQALGIQVHLLTPKNKIMTTILLKLTYSFVKKG